MWVTFVWLIKCNTESYKDQKEHISRTLHSQSGDSGKGGGWGRYLPISKLHHSSSTGGVFTRNEMNAISHQVLWSVYVKPLSYFDPLSNRSLPWIYGAKWTILLWEDLGHSSLTYLRWDVSENQAKSAYLVSQSVQFSSMLSFGNFNTLLKQDCLVLWDTPS